MGKAINSTEMPVKEKHARRIILGTHREKGAHTFWSYALGFPLNDNSILCWKFCHVMHKVLRDGHRNVLQDCMRHHGSLIDSQLHDRYGQLVALYTKLLCTKLEFHVKHSKIPPNLEVTDEVLERTAGTDISDVFQLTVQVFDYMDAELRLADTVIRQLNTSIAVSSLTSGQCRLAPLIQVIQDCSQLYHFNVKLLFKLHACLPADTLQGHRDRFHEQFRSLRSFFNKTRDMIYFKRLIQIPKLPDSPPNFLHAAALAKHVKPVVVIPADEDTEQQDDDDDDPEPLIDVSDSLAPITQVDIFDQTFGPPNGGFDDRDLQIDTLKTELDFLKTELEKVKTEAQRYVTQLKSQINSLEAELEEQRVQKQRALVENEQLRMELETTLRQLSSLLFEERAQATEQRYNKLKEKHTELVSSHAELLRKSADTVKMLSATQQTQEEVERTKHQLSFEIERIRQESELKVGLDEPSACSGFTDSYVFLHQTSDQITSSMTALQAEKERLMRSVSEKEAELSTLRQTAQVQQSSLQLEREKSSRELVELQGKLKEKVSQDSGMKQKLLDEQFALLQGTITEAENIIQDAVTKLDDPLHIRCTSSPDYLINRAEATLGSIEKMKKGHADYLRNMADAGGLLRSLTQFSHLAAETIVNGSATAHQAPTDQADRKEQLLGNIWSYLYYKRPTFSTQPLGYILKLGQDLRPKGMDIRQEELGDLVDKEMAATSAAIEEAVRRIDVSNLYRTAPKNVVTEHMWDAIRMLVKASTDLQKEIVESGKGAATIKEFYARNSRWTEGLISAAKAVGWGATEMVESADKVVLHTGKYEELIVCSHEIAASTAQLVAASKVKADRHSQKLPVLQQASRHVNEMAANLVASTKSGREHLEDKDPMDFSGMSLIKLKKEEMESQVKLLELETLLENERQRLGELRKKHYDLAGVPMEQVSEGNGELSSLVNPVTPLNNPVTMSPKPSKPALMKKPPLSQKPNVGPRVVVRLLKVD
uniref:Huntingtin interacting protein 1 related b n=1 Tax=Oryzias latipes TaxID=8090 RepID=A0A3P9MG53_ORYLA